MEKVTGRSIVKGIAIGKILLYRKEEQSVKRTKVKESDREEKRYEAARKEAVSQLNELYEKAVREVGEKEAEVFKVYIMILEDSNYTDSVTHMIRSQQVNAEYAVAEAGDKLSKVFAGMEDEYFKARTADVKDITERLVRILSGKQEKEGIQDGPIIVMADDLAPSETVQLGKDKFLAFVTRYGSVHSHTAILARAMDIPALTGVDICREWDGKMAIVDGCLGVLYVEPEPEILEVFKKRQKEDKEARELLMKLKGKEDMTLDGKKIRLYANIGSERDVTDVLENDAAGIGLFRSEFLYLESEDYPDEESQFKVYRSVAENMAGKQVIVRTLDIGADKQADYFGMGYEENPAMGYRGIRVCLDRQEIFRTQLRALFRASAYGNISIMYPMIISVDEIRQIKEITESVKEELKAQGIACGKVEQGIMIETPAAVMISDMLAEEVDFFSIGTNDLTQYTLAADRQNMKLDPIYDAHHPAVLRMIQMTVENGHKHGCRVGICGELSEDTALTRTFIEMGIDELSVPPSLVLPIRKIIRNIKAGRETV